MIPPDVFRCSLEPRRSIPTSVFEFTGTIVSVGILSALRTEQSSGLGRMFVSGVEESSFTKSAFEGSLGSLAGDRDLTVTVAATSRADRKSPFT